MSFEIVSREEELAAVRAFLGDALEAPALLVLEGEAGIGKTVLWKAGVEDARTQGFRVLVSRPAEAEQALTHSGLGDLFEPVREQVLPTLPAPRRRALELALLLEEPTAQDAVDPRALGIAVADALQLLAEGAPVLVAIDDVQWLDASSAAALAFALRRLAGAHVVLLLARRLAGAAAPLELEGAVEGVRRLPVGPLSVGALHRVLRERFGRPFARQTLLRVHERSGGNPFFALELARVFDADIDPIRPLAVPETLEELVRARIAGLPAATRDALALASAVGTVDERLLERAGVALEALAPAFASRVVERDDGTIRFSHPLLSSVLYSDLAEERLHVHARVAAVADDPLLRARHLALSKETPNAAAAEVLEEAGALAVARGASAVAAELAEQALRLTPSGAHVERHRRALAAARAQHAAGEWTRARAIADRLLAETHVGPLRADALVLLAELESVERAVVLLEEALREAAPRPALQALIECRLAWATRFRTGYMAALEHAQSALDLADDLDDDVLRRRARTVSAILGWMVGDPDAPPLTVADLDLADALGGERLVQEATLALVNANASAVRRDHVREMLEREHRDWRERDEPRAARALWGLAWVELWAARWQLAAAYAEQAHDTSIQYGIEVPQDHLPIALIALRQGRLEAARAHSERALGLAQAQFGLHRPQHLAILALVARRGGDLVAAAASFAEAEQQAARLGWREPMIRWWTDDHAEVLLELGRDDEADVLLDRWETDAALLGREWVLAQVRRCRGLAAAARGDVERASLVLEQAILEHEKVGDPFGRARALLALGVARRRSRQKRSAREAIQEALAEFEAIGAGGWVETARGELGRLGGRKREDGLTAAERRVADLAVEGRTNREIAAALFLGERTVASHLTRIYAKLGVRSRTELARKVQTF